MNERKVTVTLETGGLWFIAWLFTVAFAKLSLWQAVWALLVWPYYLGVALRGS